MTTKDEVRSTVEALKLALEALEYIENNYMSLPKVGNDAITAIRAALASKGEALAEEQEPPPECETEAEKRAYAFGWWKAMEASRAQRPVASEAKEPHKWVGLTDEEVKHMLELFAVPPHHVEMVVRAIEAKLRAVNGFSCSATEKNGGNA